VKINRAVPPPTLVPILSYPDVRAAVAFLTAAFGFVLRTRIGEDHRAQLAVGEDGAVIVADATGGRQGPPPGGVTHSIRVRVADVDAAFARARDHGAVVIEAPVDRPYGERDCTLEDPAGHRWQLAEAIADVAPEEFGCQTVSPWPAYQSSRGQVAATASAPAAVTFEGRVANLAHDGSMTIADAPPGPPRRIDGYSIGAIPNVDGPGPHGGEMHPDGDELLFVVSGAMDLILDDGDEQAVGAETTVRLGPGQAYVVPRGVWHRLEADEPSYLVHVTPGPHGPHRPRSALGH